MSYTIEYNRVFLKSNHGYTPVVLMGDSNVYSGRYNQRRVRGWTCWAGKIGVSADELTQTASNMCGGYGEHWLRHGKWVNDKDLMNWVSSGIKLATPLEPLLQTNGLNSAECALYVYNAGSNARSEELFRFCSTTKDLDNWIEEVKDRMTKSQNGDSFLPLVKFCREDLHLPPKMEGAVLLKHGKSQYVSDIDFNEDGKVCSVSWCGDIKKAMIFNSRESIPNLTRFGKFRAVKAEAQQKPYNVALRICSGAHHGSFVYSRGPHSLNVTPAMRSAKCYSDTRAAMKAKIEIEARFDVECEIFEIPETK